MTPSEFARAALSEKLLAAADASDVPIYRTEAVLKNFFKILG